MVAIYRDVGRLGRPSHARTHDQMDGTITISRTIGEAAMDGTDEIVTGSPRTFVFSLENAV